VLHPSRNTKSLWEIAVSKIPSAAADVSDVVSEGLPLMKFASSALTLGSNLLESYTDNRKNWFLYQFVDERLKCPVVEWRINKPVLQEYGPLLRGTLFLVFYGGSAPNAGVRLSLRPQIRYCPDSDIDFITPTDKLPEDKQVFLDLKPREAKTA
jgi:hypothetical protein